MLCFHIVFTLLEPLWTANRTDLNRLISYVIYSVHVPRHTLPAKHDAHQREIYSTIYKYRKYVWGGLKFYFLVCQSKIILKYKIKQIRLISE